jgi:DNA adenine methylase
MKPFLKWAGGKTRVLKHYTFPSEYSTYYEPFLGGGAVFFHLKPERSVLSDINLDLIEAYQVVRDNVEELIIYLLGMQASHCKEFYYKIRALAPEDLDLTYRVARFIYLNKTCFNGLYRVNAKGQFNVPMGDYKNPVICDEKALREASTVLYHSKAILGLSHYEYVLDYADPGDFVYFDPPYDKTFASYTKDGFGRADQERLVEVFKALDKKGVKVLLSNSDTEFIRERYKGFIIDEVKAARAINSDGNGRGKVVELVVRNYEA